MENNDEIDEMLYKYFEEHCTRIPESTREVVKLAIEEIKK